jgi:hypothetical protein
MKKRRFLHVGDAGNPNVAHAVDSEARPLRKSAALVPQLERLDTCSGAHGLMDGMTISGRVHGGDLDAPVVAGMKRGLGHFSGCKTQGRRPRASSSTTTSPREISRATCMIILRHVTLTAPAPRRPSKELARSLRIQTAPLHMPLERWPLPFALGSHDA